MAVFMGPRPRITSTAYGSALALALVAAAPSSPAAASGPGGAFSSPAPSLSTLQCRTECAGSRVSRPGSLIRLRGRNLDTSEQITFLGTRAAGDEITVEPERVTRRKVTVRVPSRAVSGRLTVANGDGAVSKPTRQALRIERVAMKRASGGPGPGIEIGLQGRKVFFDGDRRPTLTYVIHDPQPVAVVVELVRVSDGATVVRWDEGIVSPGTPRTVAWDGLAGGRVQKEGRYEFRVHAQNSAGVRASSAQATPGDQPAPPSPDSFVFLRHKFPVRGAHDYGEYVASFGGGRGHQGQDVFAACGTPLVAARGGTVKIKQSDGRAGNYVVIDGEATGDDYVYMHMRDAALVEKGERVRTGQLIGYVGDTGRVQGCHLHFEMWSGPGWYTGGSPFDPLPALKAWDRFS